MKNVFRFLIFVTFAISFTAMAAIDAMNFDNRAQEERFREIAKELRCLVCQNQSLADSNADLARDLREELLRLIKEGKSNDEITEYLVARYGNFVRYRPPFNTLTWLLWAGPALFLLVAVLTLARVIRQRARSGQPEPLSTDESQHLQDLLKNRNNESQ